MQGSCHGFVMCFLCLYWWIFFRPHVLHPAWLHNRVNKPIIERYHIIKHSHHTFFIFLGHSYTNWSLIQLNIYEPDDYVGSQLMWVTATVAILCANVLIAHYYYKSVVGTYELCCCVGAMSWYHILFIIHLYWYCCYSVTLTELERRLYIWTHI